MKFYWLMDLEFSYCAILLVDSFGISRFEFVPSKVIFKHAPYGCIDAHAMTDSSIPFNFQFPSKRWKHGADGTDYSCRRCLLTENVKGKNVHSPGQKKDVVSSDDHLNKKDGSHWVHEVVLKPVALRQVQNQCNLYHQRETTHRDRGKAQLESKQEDVGRAVHRHLEGILLEDYHDLDPLRFVPNNDGMAQIPDFTDINSY